jgi:osmotically-inducible protein OsmY
MKNDTQIQQDVLSELGHDQNVPNDIGVEVHHGVVKLAGRINDSAAKKNAEVAARRVSGVTDVVLDMDISKR